MMKKLLYVLAMGMGLSLLTLTTAPKKADAGYYCYSRCYPKRTCYTSRRCYTRRYCRYNYRCATITYRDFSTGETITAKRCRRVPVCTYRRYCVPYRRCYTTRHCYRRCRYW